MLELNKSGSFVSTPNSLKSLELTLVSSKDEEISFTQEATQNQNTSENEDSTNNDLSEFGVDSNAPDLFNNDSEPSTSNNLLSAEDDDQEDDLEIPAFLRRQKN